MKYLVIIIIGISLFSCSKTIEHTKELAQIDSTLMVVTTALDRVNSVNQDSIFYFKKEIDWYYNNIMPRHKDGDTRSFWTHEMKDLNFCRKNLETYFEQRDEVMQKLEMHKVQMTNLVHDLEEGLVADTLVEVFVLQELRSAKSTYVTYSKRLGRAIDCYQNKDSVLLNAEKVLQILNSEA